MNDNPTILLYLSRLILNPRSRQVMRELAEPYEMHRTLMRAFQKTTNEARNKFGVLFRADIDDQRDEVNLYVQSSVEPAWSFLADLKDYLCSNGEMPKPKNIMKAYKNLSNGQILSFRLRANPTKRIAKAAKGDSDLKGKRVGLLREEEQIDWLIRKAREREKGKPGGFELVMKDVEDRNGKNRPIPCVNVRREGKQIGRKRKEGHPHNTTHLAVRFDGLLRITDNDAFVETLASGIGPAKAFGFGLLSVAPPR